MAITQVPIVGAYTISAYTVSVPFSTLDSYTFSFPYLSQSDFRIEVATETVLDVTDYEFVSDYTIRLTTAGVDKLNTLYGTSVDPVSMIIFRATQLTERLVDFQDGANLTQEDLDRDSNQLFYLLQEAYDNFFVGSLTYSPIDDVIDAQGKQIVDIGDTTLLTGAVNLNVLLNNVITPDYEEDANYREGRLVFYAGDLYRANTDVFPAPAVFDAGSFDLVLSAAQLAQIATNTADIATNTADIVTNTADIATNTADIVTNTANIATNTADIATNTADIATLESSVSTFGFSVATNTSDISDNAANLVAHEADYLAHREFDTKTNLITWATTAANGSLAFATDEKLSYQVIDGVLTAIGGGGGFDPWVSETSYAVDAVIWLAADDKIYRCTTLNSDVTFTPANWQELSGNFLDGYFSITAQDNVAVTDSVGTRVLKSENYELYYEDFKDTLPSALFTSVSASLTVVDAVGTRINTSNTMASITQSSASALDSVEIVRVLPTKKDDWHLTPLKILEMLEVVGGSGTFSVKIQESSDGISFTDAGEISQLDSGVSLNKNILQFSDASTHVKLKFIVVDPDDATTLNIHRILISTDAFPVGQITKTNSISLSGNSNEPVTFNVTNIPFSGTGIGWSSANREYKIQFNDSVLKVKVGIEITANSAREIRIYKNGVFYKLISQIITNTAFTGDYVSKAGEFIKGDLISFRVSFNGGTLVNTPEIHYLNIVETAYADNVIVDAATFNADSEMRFVLGTGFGSTGTKIRRMTTQVGSTIGDAFIYTPSAVNGDSWELTQSGVYTFTVSDINAGGGGSTNFGLSLNASGADLSTNIFSLASSKQLGGAQLATGFSGASKSYTGYFNIGDIIRFHSDGSGSASNASTSITLAKIATPPSFISLDVSSERGNDYGIAYDNAGSISNVRIAGGFTTPSQVTRLATGRTQVVFNTDFFGVTPIITPATKQVNNYYASIEAESASSFIIETRRSDTGGLIDTNVRVHIMRSDSDWRAPQAFIAGQVALTEARTDGVEYRTNEKVDGQWVYARTYKADVVSISATTTIATIPTGLNVVSFQGHAKNSSNNWYESGSNGLWEMIYFGGTGVLQFQRTALTWTAYSITIKYLK